MLIQGIEYLVALLVVSWSPGLDICEQASQTGDNHARHFGYMSATGDCGILLNVLRRPRSVT